MKTKSSSDHHHHHRQQQQISNVYGAAYPGDTGSLLETSSSSSNSYLRSSPFTDDNITISSSSSQPLSSPSYYNNAHHLHHYHHPPEHSYYATPHDWYSSSTVTPESDVNVQHHYAPPTMQHQPSYDNVARSATPPTHIKSHQLHRLNLFILIRILFQYLEKADPLLLTQAKQVLKDCDRRKKLGECQSLADIISVRLHETVGDTNWTKALALHRQFLKSKQKQKKLQTLKLQQQPQHQQRSQKQHQQHQHHQQHHRAISLPPFSPVARRDLKDHNGNSDDSDLGAESTDMEDVYDDAVPAPGTPC